jgi:hypothetical protein
MSFRQARKCCPSSTRRDPSYRTVKGILAAGTEYTTRVLILDDFAVREHTAMHADDLYELISDRAISGKPFVLTGMRASRDGFD